MKTALFISACMAVFALLAAQVFGDGAMAHVDLQVTQWLAAHRSGWVTQSMLLIAEAHRTLPVVVATALVAGWLARRHGWRGALPLGAVPTGMLLNVGLKNLFDRARPALDEPLVHLTTFSFPSGHAAASTLFYGTLFALVLMHVRERRRRALAAAVAVTMIALVCYSRVYLGAHYLSDVLAAICVALAWLVAWHRAIGRGRDRTHAGG